MDAWIVLETFRGREVAEMMRALLEDQGVPAVVTVDDAGGMRPELAFVLGAKLLVAPGDEARARDILEHRGAPEDGSDDID